MKSVLSCRRLRLQHQDIRKDIGNIDQYRLRSTKPFHNSISRRIVPNTAFPTAKLPNSQLDGLHSLQYFPQVVSPENLVEHDLDVVAGVPVAEALLRVLADRQVSPTVLSSSLFRHERSLRGKFGGVNFRLCSRRRFTLTRQVASTRQAAFTSFRRGRQRAAFPVPPVGSRRKSARGLAQSKTLRAVRRPLENAPASLDCQPSAVLLRRTGGGPPPLSIQGAANRLSLCRFRERGRGRGRSGFGLLNLMGCSPHSFLRAQRIQFPK